VFNRLNFYLVLAVTVAYFAYLDGRKAYVTRRSST